MYKCDVCGRESFRKIRLNGMTLCDKHKHQFKKYGKFLDNNPRTTKDLNDYKIINSIVYFNLYNQKNEKIGEFFIDLDDIEKVKYHKWRLSNGHVVTGNAAYKNNQELSHIVLDFDRTIENKVVDHIDGNPLNNTRNNLRICSQANNVLNKSFMSNNTSGFIGISFKKDRKLWVPEIQFRKIRCHLGATKDLKQAVYKRYYAEKLLFKEFANKQEQDKKYNFTKDLPQNIKDSLEKVVEEKLRNKNLWP